MKKIIALILSLFAFAMTSTVNAEVAEIWLGGVNVLPGREAVISAKQLSYDATYRIHCTVLAPNDTIMTFMIGGVFTYNQVLAEVNGKSIGSIAQNSRSGALKSGANDFTITRYDITVSRSDAVMHFHNLDATGTVIVSNCTAKPII